MEEKITTLNELVRKAQSGDISSYELIVKRFQSSAFSQAFFTLGDSYLAEDAVQDAFVEAYRKLNTLRAPEAFATWFHRIVFSSCSRIKLGRSEIVTSLGDIDKNNDTNESPADRFEREQREQAVYMAIQALPDSLRMVTALYYIGGISQADIADYLSLTQGTVKKRLFDARKRLREDIKKMANTISESRIPPEEISARVIAELVSRPQPLLIKDHQIRQLFDQIRSALPDYEMIDSSEVEEEEIYASVKKSFFQYPSFKLDTKHVLRSQTSGATFRAIKGRQAPVRLLTAGRVFRPEQEDETHLMVFHQLDGICVAPDAPREELKAKIEVVIEAVLGDIEIRFQNTDHHSFIDHGMDVYVRTRGTWVEVSGCGMLKPEMLKEAGYDPLVIKGYAFGLGLDRLAMIKFGIDNILDLWGPKYLRLV